MKRLIIAEKPSVATDLSKVLGKFKKLDGYYENDEYVISSAVGHIVELFMPDDIDKKLKWWSLKTLPIIPEKFQLKPIEKTKDRLKELKELMKRDDIKEIINACDAGREGELIFAYIYEITKSKKPIKRLWMSSMTPESIKEAFQHLRSNEEMIPLQEAARCRSESDWLVGINGTRAVTSRMFGQRSRQVATVGRVQTPTLALVYEREKAIKNFTPQNYWRIFANFGISNGEYQGYYQKPDYKKGEDDIDRIDRIWDKAQAEQILSEVRKASAAEVTETQKNSKQAPPLLYDLTALQREANSRFGTPAGITLKIAQSLYEKHKVITYPRTDSKALPEDYGPTCIKVLKNITGYPKEHANTVLKNNWVNTANKRNFNNSKISDHFAIIPTEITPSKLSEDEAKIYDMIVRRFVAAFFPSAEFLITTRMSNANGHVFKTEGKVLVSEGWLAVYGKAGNLEESLPALSEKDGQPPQAKILESKIEEEETKPPARYSEATLLAAMEHAGKFIEDEDLADALKEKGLGTPATRAQIIEHLIREKYMERVQRELIPTIKAENLIEFLKVVQIEQLTSPAMTGEWEFKLHEIELGQLTRKSFMTQIEDMTKDMVEKTRTFDEFSIDTKISNIISPTDNQPMIETFRAYRSQDEALTIYKTMGNRKLTEEEIKELLEKKSIGPLDDFKSKAGKPFSAMLKLDEDWKVKFDFGTTEGEEGGPIDYTQFEPVCKCPLAERGLCSYPEGTVYATPQAYQCEHYKEPGTKCTFRVSRNLLSRSIPEDQFKKLVNEGKTDLLDKFKSNRTKRFFSAHLILKEDGTIGFEFEKKAPKEKKPRKVAKKKTTA
ncbi:MAG: DNA topoisomerase III [Verrucomicrobia bacterium]|nr:MAG: DNA topoisomerase III [Verrucomicrobiota bacterium]